MRLDTWDEDAAVRYDRTLWTDLTSLRFLDAAHGAVILGAVGVGKTHLATALGHIAVRRRIPTLMLRSDAMFKRLRASRLDNSTEAEMRRLAQVRLLIIDDFALQPLDATATADFYELVVARHQRSATIVTSNRGPDEWLTVMTDAMLAESAVDRLTSTAHELIVEGPSTANTRSPRLTLLRQTQIIATEPIKWSLARGQTMVPSPWQVTCRGSSGSHSFSPACGFDASAMRGDSSHVR
jgi:DNA replication protein DnaC